MVSGLLAEYLSGLCFHMHFNTKVKRSLFYQFPQHHQLLIEYHVDNTNESLQQFFLKSFDDRNHHIINGVGEKPFFFTPEHIKTPSFLKSPPFIMKMILSLSDGNHLLRDLV